MKKRSHFNCYYELKYHLVLVSKNGQPCFNKAIQDFIKSIMLQICGRWDVRVIRYIAKPDHVHLYLLAHPDVQMSKFINALKTNTSRMTRKHFSGHLSRYFIAPIMWERGYCLLTYGGSSLNGIIDGYVNQYKGSNFDD